MYQWEALVQVMACHLFAVKPISEPMLFNCQLDPQEQAPVKFYAEPPQAAEVRSVNPT